MRTSGLRPLVVTTPQADREASVVDEHGHVVPGVLARPAGKRASCKLEGCDGRVKGRGWCDKHYKRWQTHGDPEVVVVYLDAAPLLEAFDRRLNARAAFGDRPRIERLLPDVSDRRAFHRARRAGRVTECTADRLSVRGLGLTVDEVYGLEACQEAV